MARNVSKVSEENVVATEQAALPGSRWARLIPLVFVSYSLAYLDRVNYGFGAAGGLAKTLGITSFTSAWLGALFFLGYFFFQVPWREFRRASQCEETCLLGTAGLGRSGFTDRRHHKHPFALC